MAEDGAAIKQPVLLVILDGFGFNPRTEAEVLQHVAGRLPDAARAAILHIARESASGAGVDGVLSEDALLHLLLSPVFPTVALAPAYRQVPWDSLAAIYRNGREAMAQTPGAEETLLEAVECRITEAAYAARYTIWAASSPFINKLRNSFPTVPTQAAGLAAGYEDLVPAVQGNSETGHQQIGNFIVAAQTPLQISTEIADGRFFENPMLIDCLNEVKERGTSLDVCFLLSGEYGNDGRVHSAWNHLEALLEAVFVRAGLTPDRLRIEAILDGRDSPPYSSVQRSGDKYGFLYKLRDLLAKYGATESLAWVIGRSIAMDRDYEESRTKQDYDLMINGQGLQVDDIEGAIAAVQRFHEQGNNDPNVPPIAVGTERAILRQAQDDPSTGSGRAEDPPLMVSLSNHHGELVESMPRDKTREPRRIGDGDVFLDLNFRADRQRGKIASLLGAREFLAREAAAKGQTWDMGWLNPPANLAVYCLSEYHPDFEQKYGARVLYPIRPQAHNLFALVAEQSQAQGFPFHYLLTAESTKALHVGYFIRGRREQPAVAGEEERRIIPTYGREFGVATDDDYYKTPQMRAFALADFVVESLAHASYDLIALNLSNTDMVGHLMPRHYDAAERSVTLIDTVLETIVPAAERNGFAVVLTADHGNVEDNDASHTANEVLTSFITAGHALRLRHDPREPARLFDIPWCIVEIMGITDRIVPHLPPIPEAIDQQGLVGRNLIEVIGDR